MNLALWIIAIVLAVAFAASGLMKQLVPKDQQDDSASPDAGPRPAIHQQAEKCQ